MAKKPKFKTGFIIFAIITLTVFAIALKKVSFKPSTGQIEIGENNFKLSFNIQPRDQDKLEKSLEKLNIPKDVLKGANFELDSTSQATLAVVSPVTFKVKPTDDMVEVEGHMTRPLTTKNVKEGKLKLPKSTNVALASQSLSSFAKSKLGFPESLKDWVQTASASDYFQYFINFGTNENVYVFKNQDQLKDIKNLESKELSLKEESQDDAKIVYLTFQNPQTQQNQTLSLISEGDYTYIASSPQSAREIINLQKSSKNSFEFPFKSKEKVVSALYAKNNNEEFINTLRSIILNASPNTIAFAKNIDYFYLVLSQMQFSGLINIRGN